MSRYIDADKLIDDLEHDIAIDQDHILYVGIDMIEKELIQFDKDCKQNCIDMLSKAPTADVRENVKGRWVEVVDRTEMYDKEGVKTWGMLFQCNQCGFVLNAIEGHTGQYNYCPNCGAEMRGEKMPRYIDSDKIPRHGKRGGECYWQEIEQLQTADVVEIGKPYFYEEGYVLKDFHNDGDRYFVIEREDT